VEYEIDGLLKELGYQQSDHDPCVYYKTSNRKMVIIAIYVDDLLIFSNDEVEKQKLKSSFMKDLKMKDLREAHYCLGVKISLDRNQGCITVDQKQYIENLLKRFRMEDCNGVQTPLDVGQNLFDVELQRINDGIKFDVPYQEAVGSLMY
jgi:hypothetical protein